MKLVGYLNYETGEIYCEEHESYDAEVFLGFLKNLLSKNKNGKTVVILEKYPPLCPGKSQLDDHQDQSWRQQQCGHLQRSADGIGKQSEGLGLFGVSVQGNTERRSEQSSRKD